MNLAKVLFIREDLLLFYNDKICERGIQTINTFKQFKFSSNSSKVEVSTKVDFKIDSYDLDKNYKIPGYTT